MDTVSAAAAAHLSVPAIPSASHPTSPSGPVFRAAKALLVNLERGETIDAGLLRKAMEDAFGASDATGLWDWKTAYEACEAASVLFLRKYGRAIFAKSPQATARLSVLEKIVALLPSQTRRSDTSETFQQFSTPLPLGLVAIRAAAIVPGDLVLEPSAGTGLLVVLAETMGAGLHLNELANLRCDLLGSLFGDVAVTRVDAAQIHDHLDPMIVPSLVVMNPPFSVLNNVSGKVSDAAARHVLSALARLAPGGRLVTITGAGFSPDHRTFEPAFAAIREMASVTFSAPIDGSVYARHGTMVETRLTVIDKTPSLNVPNTAFPGMAPDIKTLLDWIEAYVPPRQPCRLSPVPSHPPAVRATLLPALRARRLLETRPGRAPENTIELTYEPIERSEDRPPITEAIYEAFDLQAFRIPDARPHPTRLVQSAAMASVVPPLPTYRPHLPASVISQGLLSDAQLESVIFAGEAHSAHLAGHWTLDETFDVVSAAANDAPGAVQFRRGWFLGDGTGAGKGRQGAAIILDNWLKGRRKALWVSKSDKLLEDAQRDWSALGQERLLITPLSRFRQGTAIPLPEGILFTTYATLRSEAGGGTRSRISQIIDWLGRDFDGVLLFDESHAMQNAAGGKGERGDQEASQQGRAGLRLQRALPNARVVYVSATGATNVQNLAYAERLGLWGGEDFPFATRSEFVEAIEAGGVAAMEVLARDLRALGLYSARSLSYEGIEYDLVEHQLTPEQISIYDAYAKAFEVIHNNLDAAMKAANISGSSSTLNAQAKSAARSAFESAKQRFFGHLLTSMKTPTLMRRIDDDLAAGRSSVIQIVSTGEALMERRLCEIPTEDWGDVRVDITPREYVLDYLAHSFPVQLYEPYSDDEGKLLSRPVYRDGQPVECRDAVERRDRLVERLAALPAVPGALDQIVQRFGSDAVAEVTGRSRRIIRKQDRLMVESRAGSANLTETQAFMDDIKRILVFSDAGGTGRSYHAELSAKNQRLRVHYLLEPGWKADAAIQGLGRTNRTNQAQPPLFRPISTDVKAEKRFLSTIARRLDTLGAITRGQRQTGGQGLFRPEDNLESDYARAALRQLYGLIYRGKLEGCSLETFEAVTGLKLTDNMGLKDELPPISTFLNRLLALTIAMQGILFTAFEQLLSASVQKAIEAGIYDVGLETVRADSLVITDRRSIYSHPATGASTQLLTITQRLRNRPLQAMAAIEFAERYKGALLINEKSGRAAVQTSAPSLLLDTGEVEARIALKRPMGEHQAPLALMADSMWEEAGPEAFVSAWQAEVDAVPEFSESTLHVVTGLLLPIWKRLPSDSARVIRLETDAGERIVGRRVPQHWVASQTQAEAPAMGADEVFRLLRDGRAEIELADGLSLGRSRVMSDYRIELEGFGEASRDRLKAYGLFGEIIAWKYRMFVPTHFDGAGILAKLIERHPLVRVREKGAA